MDYEFSEQLDFGKGTQVAIITLWTKKELIKKQLTSNYAIIGQLYSPEEGINALIRNLLSHKNIRDVIITGADLSGSGEILKNFFETGTMDNLDEEIPASTIERLREHVLCHDFRKKSVKEIDEFISTLEKKEAWGTPEKFPKKKIKEPDTFPSEKAGFLIREDKIKDAWLRVLHYIMEYGEIKQSQYSEPQKELISLVTVTREDSDNPDIGHCFDFSKDDLERYYPQVLTNQSFREVSYTYGQRLRNYEGTDQIEKIIEKLRQDDFSRRAVAFTWRHSDIEDDKCPCLSLVQALIQNNELYLTVYLRSNDMYNAWPRNAFALRKLQSIIAKRIGVNMGSLVTISNSAHLYKNSWKKADQILAHFYAPYKSIGDSRGNYVIKVEDEIILTRQSPDGKRIAEYKGTSAKKLFEKIHEQISDISHALYMGRELTKAEYALNNNTSYKQD